MEPMYQLQGKSAVVTGACGTIGSALIRRLLSLEPGVGSVTGIDNNESEIARLADEYHGEARASFFVADIRDNESMTGALRGADVVFHCAAFKHVNLCERSPMEAIKTNVLGIQTIINASRDAGVERVVFTSSDKAVHPISVMGMTKLLGETLAASAGRGSAKPVFITTRFGNVLGSSGSVVPLFVRQIRTGGPVTVTDERMTRFVMSLDQAVQLVVDSATIGESGDIFVTKMPTLNVGDLAQALIEEVGNGISIKVESVGVRPGEKIHEELMTPLEMTRSIEFDNYLVIVPEHRAKVPRAAGASKQGQADMQSEFSEKMTVSQIRKFLRDHVLPQVAI